MLSFLMVAALISAIAAITDLKSGRIPNWLTFAGVVSGIAGHVLQGWYHAGWQTGLHEGVDAFAGLLLCTVAPAVCYWKGAMGGGDLKLFAALGALCQPTFGIECQFYALAIAGIVAPVRLAYRGTLLRVLIGSFWIVANPLLPAARRRRLPVEAMTWFRLGPAIWAGSLVVLTLHGGLGVDSGKAVFP